MAAQPFPFPFPFPCPFTKFLITYVEIEKEIYRYCTNTNSKHQHQKSNEYFPLLNLFLLKFKCTRKVRVGFCLPGQFIWCLSTRSTFDLQVLFSSIWRVSVALHSGPARAEVLLTASVLACAPAPTPQDFKVFVQLTVSAISYGLYLWLLFAICLFN